MVLGSASPRRKDLLAQLGVKFTIRPADVDEEFPEDLPTDDVAEWLARHKGEWLAPDLRDDEILITADTVVILNGKILGKPRDRNEAFEMLRSLSGKAHLVQTGVCLRTRERQRSFSERTEVFFRALNDDEIRHYIDHYQPMDKAGAYGIQEWIGLVAVEGIKGCFFNVIGLPVPRLYVELSQFSG